MAYLKPPWFTAKVFNRIAMATGISNSETLTVTKRGSKEPQHIPVVTVDIGGTRYLVSTRGESQWVKNARAGAPGDPDRVSEEGGQGCRRLLPQTARSGGPPGIRAHCTDDVTGKSLRDRRASRDGAGFHGCWSAAGQA